LTYSAGRCERHGYWYAKDEILVGNIEYVFSLEKKGGDNPRFSMNTDYHIFEKGEPSQTRQDEDLEFSPSDLQLFSHDFYFFHISSLFARGVQSLFACMERLQETQLQM